MAARVDRMTPTGEAAATTVGRRRVGRGTPALAACSTGPHVLWAVREWEIALLRDCGRPVRRRCPSGRSVIRLLLVSALRRWSAPGTETAPQGTTRRP